MWYNKHDLKLFYWVVTVLFIIIIILILISILLFKYSSRIATVKSIKKVTHYNHYNIYKMDVLYNYNLKKITSQRLNNDQDFMNSMVKTALPYIPISIQCPDFGNCSVFTIKDEAGTILMGRNYDFKNNTSAMLVHSAPKDGYESVGFSALDNLKVSKADASIKSKFSCLLAPFACLDGMNEKGVCIAVLTLDSYPTKQNTGKPTIATTLIIRLVLDKAATTQEAVDIIKQYDVYSMSGKDYHFYITDAFGDGRIVEFDPETKDRVLVDTASDVATNFFIIYKEHVLPNQKNGIYGHGRERYNAIIDVMNKHKQNLNTDVAWQALKAASQEPDPIDITSNTQWSIVFNTKELSASIVLRRDWNTVNKYYLTTNELKPSQ